MTVAQNIVPDTQKELPSSQGARVERRVTVPDVRLWSITGWQSLDAPHWHEAIIEARDEQEAKDILLLKLLEENVPDEVWGWDDKELKPGSFQDDKLWKTKELERPFVFILGGGCR